MSSCLLQLLVQKRRFRNRFHSLRWLDLCYNKAWADIQKVLSAPRLDVQKVWSAPRSDVQKVWSTLGQPEIRLV